jgi:hypothetical protein
VSHLFQRQNDVYYWPPFDFGSSKELDPILFDPSFFNAWYPLLRQQHADADSGERAHGRDLARARQASSQLASPSADQDPVVRDAEKLAEGDDVELLDGAVDPEAVDDDADPLKFFRSDSNDDEDDNAGADEAIDSQMEHLEDHGDEKGLFESDDGNDEDIDVVDYDLEDLEDLEHDGEEIQVEEYEQGPADDKVHVDDFSEDLGVVEDSMQPKSKNDAQAPASLKAELAAFRNSDRDWNRFPDLPARFVTAVEERYRKMFDAAVLAGVEKDQVVDHVAKRLAELVPRLKRGRNQFPSGELSYLFSDHFAAHRLELAKQCLLKKDSQTCWFKDVPRNLFPGILFDHLRFALSAMMKMIWIELNSRDFMMP